MTGTLYIVPTPIGNLEDITLRALRILREVSLIAAEDTRTTKFLLNHYEIKTPLTSYHEHNKTHKLEAMLDALASGDVALVSDAGMPGISDPGYELVKVAIEHRISIVPLPGATAIIPALVGSGLPTDRFLFVGFLPKKNHALQICLQDLRTEASTLIAYDNPYRLVDSLHVMLKILGNRQICVAREVSKLFEEFHRNTIEGAIQHFQQENPRGEITIVLAGAEAVAWDETQIRAILHERLQAGESLNNIAKSIAKESGWKKSEVYRLGLEDG